MSMILNWLQASCKFKIWALSKNYSQEKEQKIIIIQFFSDDSDNEVAPKSIIDVSIERKRTIKELGESND